MRSAQHLQGAPTEARTTRDGLGSADPFQLSDDWGPLARLAGEWEGDVGLDTAFSHSSGELVATPYRERASLRPFGPVRNGRQRLFGLDYRTSMFRESESVSFHEEVGYWLWDAENGEVMRAFVIPRGVSVLAGGLCAADSMQISLAADLGMDGYGITENTYLRLRASSLSYRSTTTVHSDETWSYDQVTMLQMSERSEPVAHTDRNTLRRIGS